MSVTVPLTDALDPDHTPDGPTRSAVSGHLESLVPVLQQLQGEVDRLARWSEALAACLVGGGRVLAAGNGGSAAEAQHLTAELVGRFDGDRRPFSAICLHGDTSSVTAIANDYGYDQVFARQVHAHARAGDIVVLMSGSGRSANLLRAAEAARTVGATSWAMTGPGPNPLADCCDDALVLPGRCGNVQEGHLLALHAVCCGFESQVRVLDQQALSGPEHQPGTNGVGTNGAGPAGDGPNRAGSGGDGPNRAGPGGDLADEDAA